MRVYIYDMLHAYYMVTWYAVNKITWFTWSFVVF